MTNVKFERYLRNRKKILRGKIGDANIFRENSGQLKKKFGNLREILGFLREIRSKIKKKNKTK